MAVIKSNEVRSGSCRFVTGLDEDGNEKYATRAIANFKAEADLESVNETILAIASLYPYGVKAVILTERAHLEEA